ncbi:hypothetical protein Tco_0977888 [Tanacetum coccineum]|uniref:Uncharacterized protein n=1 Tax=Tanacetum coccineum TaxID=301880 RepID=A0ABQ5ELE9_9ASTR
MEEANLHTTRKQLFIYTQYYDKHGVPPTKRLFKVAMLDVTPELLDIKECLDDLGLSTVYTLWGSFEAVRKAHKASSSLTGPKDDQAARSSQLLLCQLYQSLTLEGAEPIGGNLALESILTKRYFEGGRIRLEMFLMTCPKTAPKAKSLASHISSKWFSSIWGQSGLEPSLDSL